MVKVFKRVVDIIFVFAIVILALYFVLRFMGRIEICEVETGSMEDGIHAGDYVLIYKKNIYKIGDVITYKKDGYYITHRIVKKHKKGIVTKGDANNTEDDPIKVSSIVGKVILVGGVLNIIISFKYGIAALLLGLYLLSCYIGKEDTQTGEKNILKKNEKTDDVEKVETKKVSIVKVKKVNNSVDLLARKRLRKRIRPEYRKSR